MNRDDRPNYCYGCNDETGNAWICDACGPAYWKEREDSSEPSVANKPYRTSPDDPLDEALYLRISVRRAQLEAERQLQATDGKEFATNDRIDFIDRDRK